MSTESPPPPRPVRVWDLPLRVFHWGLAGAFGAAFLTGDAATRLDVHVLAGTIVGLLLLFRVWWARRGTRFARGGELLVAPRVVTAYLREMRDGRAVARAGHTPLAAWAALAGLGLLAMLTLTGLLVLGGEEQVGVLRVIPVWFGVWVHPAHTVAAWACVGWLAAHLVGVAKESLRTGVNLPWAMVRGYKRVAPAVTVPLRGGVAGVLVGGLLPLGVLPPQAATRAAAAPIDARWQAECGSCHLAYDPALLPARGWQQLFTEQHAHFGDDLLLDEATTAELVAWATGNAAELGRNEASVRILHTTPATSAPTRITDLPWWTGVHADVPADDLEATNSGGRCGGCHPDARVGRFDPLFVQPFQGG